MPGILLEEVNKIENVLPSWSVCSFPGVERRGAEYSSVIIGYSKCEGSKWEETVQGLQIRT